MEPKKCTELSTRIIELVGGKENVEHVLHCASRLRFNLKDYDKADVDTLNKTSGVVRAINQQGQLQVIIGPEVAEVYNEICRQGDFEVQAAVDEAPDAPKDRSLKGIGLAIIDAVSACVNPVLPVIIAAGMVKLIVTLLGPAFLGILNEGTDLHTLLSFVGDAGFYFFPIFVAYAGARKFGCSVPLALLIGGILLHPTYNAIVSAGQPFTVYGLPVVLTSYASNFIPMILITWVMSYIEKWITKVCPASLKSLLVPTCTLLIMLPLSFCVLGPIGTVVGQGIAAAMQWMHDTFGGLSTAIVGAFWMLLVGTGMHQALIAIALGQMATIGYDDSIMVGALIAAFACFAIAGAYTLKTKDPQERSIGASYFITSVFGGIWEPTIFGVMFKYTKSLLYVFAGGFIGGLIAGVMGAKVYFFSGLGNVFCLLGFAGEDPRSIVWATVACVVTFVVTFALAMIFGFEDKKTNA